MIDRLQKIQIYPVYILAFALICAVIRCGEGDRDMVSKKLNKYLPDYISGFKAAGSLESYDRDTIFKYMDGAGEVYLQYDFREMAVRQYVSSDSQQVTVELFDMGIVADAYGIFSHSREEAEAGFGQGSEFKGGLLSFWKGRYFACVYCDEQTGLSDSSVLGLGRAIDFLVAEKGEIPAIIGYLPDDGLIKARIRFFHKYTSLNLHFYLSEENLLNLSERTDAVLAEYGAEKTHLLLIGYPTEQDAADGLTRFKSEYIPKADSSGAAVIADGKWAMAQAISNYVIVVLDSPDRQNAEELIAGTRIIISAKSL